MDGTAVKVSEIFREVGIAFSTLSEITILLQHTEESPPGGKWTEEGVEMLRGCIKRFAEELNKITHHIKTRTMYHLRRLLEMDSGVIRDVSSSPPGAPPPQVQQAPEPAPLPEPPTPTLTINHYLYGFDDNNTEDDLLQSFNPGIVPPFPPEQILQPERSEPSPLFEFEDIQLDQINLDRINLLVPDLLKALDDFAMPTSAEPEPNQNVHPLPQDIRHETPMANIATHYAEPAATENGKEVSGAFSSIRNEAQSSHNGPGQCNSFHISIRPNDIKWDLNNTEAKIEAVKTSPPPNRQITWLKPGETSGHQSSYAGQIKIKELPDLTGPSGSSRNDERPFNIFKNRQAETTPSTTFKAPETKEESKPKETFNFFKYAQAKQQEQQSNMFKFPHDSKDIDKNKEESPSRNRNEDNKPRRFFNFRQPAEPRTSSGFGSLGNPSSRWMDEVSDDASTAQTFERSHSPLEIDVKATFLPIRADNKIEPFNRNKQVQPLVARRSRRLSQTTPTTPTTLTTPTTSTIPTSEPTGPYDFLVPAAENIPAAAAARKQEQKPRSRRRKAPAAKSGEGTPAKRSRKNSSGPSGKALKNKKMPKKE
nr:uncharacterized protein LOC110378183 isoform X1 [Helicoverpa armigera]